MQVAQQQQQQQQQQRLLWAMEQQQQPLWARLEVKNMLVQLEPNILEA